MRGSGTSAGSSRTRDHPGNVPGHRTGSLPAAARSLADPVTVASTAVRAADAPDHHLAAVTRTDLGNALREVQRFDQAPTSGPGIRAASSAPRHHGGGAGIVPGTP